MNPTRINNYNKFLSTLDENSKNNNDDSDNKKPNKELKELIEYIFGNFDSNNISSPNFTGQKPNHTSSLNNNIPNPNNYRDFSEDCCIKKKREKNQKKTRRTRRRTERTGDKD